MYPQSIFWCSSEPGKPVEPAYPSEKRQRESNKSKVVNFHPILCMPAPSINRSQRESKYESIVQETRRNFEMSQDKRKKRNRLITNFWVAKPKKLATPRCFNETRVIGSKSKMKSLMCKEKETNYSASKSASPSNPTQTPDWFSLQSSCHPVSKDK